MFLQLPHLKHSKDFLLWNHPSADAELLDTEVGFGLWDMWKQYKAKTEANQDDRSFAVAPTALITLCLQASLQELSISNYQTA